MTEILKSGLTALVASLFCIWLLRPLAMRLGLVDRPNDRKRHENEVPLIGGIAMFFGFCFALLTLPVSLQPYRSMLAGSSILVLMGVIDDFKDLSSKLRLLGQIFAAFLLVVWGHVILQYLGNIFFIGNLKLGLLALPLTVLIVVTYLNAMNMVDGQDGLAGGVAVGQAILLLILSMRLHRYVDMHLLIILIGCLLVFLSYNMRLPWRRRASIFMGDAGSTFIAFLLAWFAIDLSQHNQALVKPITVLWIMAFPVFDLITVIVLRIRQQKPILVASRDHVHHVLHVAGINTSLSTLLLCGLSVSFGVLGFILDSLAMPEAWQFVLWLVGLVFYIYIVDLTRKPLMQEDPLPIDS
jgi:undecaprenyl-phosphate alpha-N-acetylglucosaminyl 1-phosphatetransferase